ncbi:MAG: hypothetical protein R2855_12225 [Thermomicrobiales bacterium]
MFVIEGSHDSSFPLASKAVRQLGTVARKYTKGRMMLFTMHHLAPSACTPYHKSYFLGELVTGRWLARRGTVLVGGQDILVDPEEIAGIVLGLDPGETLVVGP